VLTKDKIDQAVIVAGNEEKLKRLIKTRLLELFGGADFNVKTDSLNLIEIIIDELLATRSDH
jgi:hypothetical protein